MKYLHIRTFRLSRFTQSPLKEPTANQPLLITSHFHGFHSLPPSALQAALQLAEEISSFPQQCLLADRSSAIYSSYDAPSFKQVKPCSLCSATLGRSWNIQDFSAYFQAMQYEINHGTPAVQAESVAGATRFTTGAGRGGTFS